jgi:uncharacterized ferredoxin-like protein
MLGDITTVAVEVTRVIGRQIGRQLGAVAQWSGLVDAFVTAGGPYCAATYSPYQAMAARARTAATGE